MFSSTSLSLKFHGNLAAPPSLLFGFNLQR